MAHQQECALVWFQLVDTTGKETTYVDAVSLPLNSLLVQFRDAVKAKYADSHLKGVAPSDLIVYQNKDAFSKKDADPCKSSQSLNQLGTTDADALFVVVPAILEQVSAASDFIGTGFKRRIRADEWFPFPRVFSKRVKEDQEKEIEKEVEEQKRSNYFVMESLPPLAHSQEKYKLIVERECYKLVFQAIFDRAKSRLEKGWDTNMHVSGNPGIGKSRFYLYFIFRLLSDRDFVLTYRLVINFRSNYFLYDSAKEEFICLNQNEVKILHEDKRVFRLIEAESDELTGWKGVSVLFASPGVLGLNDFMKVESVRFFLPVWTWEELSELNYMQKVRLSESVLIERFDMFGGIPRFIFTDSQDYEKDQLTLAINSFDALRILSYAKGKTVRESDYSHRVMCMVPTNDFKSISHLDFLSIYIAEKIVDKVSDDSINEISSFFVASTEDDSGTSASTRGRIYELLCHRRVKRGLTLTFRLIGSKKKKKIVTLEVPADVQVLRFVKLDDIPFDIKGISYCQPFSRSFGALDSFVLDITKKKCYALQMTVSKHHGIKCEPLLTFLKWLKNMDIDFEFIFGFLTPKRIADEFPKQDILTRANTVHQKPGNIGNMKQYVVALDIIDADPATFQKKSQPNSESTREMRKKRTTK